MIMKTEHIKNTKQIVKRGKMRQFDMMGQPGQIDRGAKGANICNGGALPLLFHSSGFKFSPMKTNRSHTNLKYI